MAEFSVTALTYFIGEGLSREESKAAVKDFFKGLKVGTQLILQAEPTNIHDENAVAVYMMMDGEMKQIGYVKGTRCLEVKTLLNEDDQCDAIVLGNDGKKTMFIDIPNAPETVITINKKERVLPRIPLEEVLKMDFTKEEKTLQVVAPRLLKIKPTAENIPTLIELATCYLPLSAQSICFIDGVWRDHILTILKAACKLEVAPELKQQLEDLRGRLEGIEADQTRTSDHPKLKVMESQLEKLKVMSEAEDGLFVNFEIHIATSGRSVKEELSQLKNWFLSLPHLYLRDYNNHDRLSERLFYQHVSRKELYEVYAAMLLIERYAQIEEETATDFTDIKNYVGKVGDLLAADWTEKMYDALWDSVLALPAVKAIAKKVGKQKDTSFNRNLIAHILHTMMKKGVFGPSVTNQAMAEALEGNKDHSVRASIGESMKDKVMKTSIEKLIAEKK